jgi:hypothetical protein
MKTALGVGNRIGMEEGREVVVGPAPAIQYALRLLGAQWNERERVRDGAVTREEHDDY